MTEYHAMAKNGQASFPAARDPFYVVKEKVEELHKKLQSEMPRWKDMLQNSNTSTNPDFAQTTKSIRHTIKQMGAYLNDLQRTIDIVEKNRARFLKISDEELDSRRSFVAQMKRDSNKMEQTLDAPRTLAKMEADKRAALFEEDRKRANAGLGSGLDRELSREATGFVDEKRQKQLHLEAKQDEVLEDMSTILDRLQVISTEVNEEIKEQEVILDDIDREVESAKGTMDVALTKMDRLLGSSDKGRWFCIGFLIITAFIMFIILLF